MAWARITIIFIATNTRNAWTYSCLGLNPASARGHLPSSGTRHTAWPSTAYRVRPGCRLTCQPSVNELLTARPQIGLAGPLDQLGANAIPFPFDNPAVWQPQQAVELLQRQMERKGEKKGIGLAAGLLVQLAILLRLNQYGVVGRAGLSADAGVAHQALGHAPGINRPLPPAPVWPAAATRRRETRL